MASSAESVVAQKIKRARKTNSPIPRLNDVSRAFGKSVEEGVRQYLDAVVEAFILECDIKKFSDVLDGISMPAMIGMVEMNGRRRAALVNLDASLTYHTVDLRMGGSPSELPEFVARRATATDEAMCRPLVDVILRSFNNAIADCFQGAELGQLLCHNFEHLPMLANIAGEHSDVLVLQVNMDIGEAARSGNFDLVIPLTELDMVKALLKEVGFAAAAKSEAWSRHMSSVVLDSEVELTPALETLSFSVAELSRLDVGDVIALSPEVQNNVSISIDLPTGSEVVATGRLGAFKQHKALKLIDSPDRELFAPLRDAVATAHATREETL